MPDNITIALNIRTRKFRPKKLLPDGSTITLKRSTRTRIYNPSGGDLQVRRTNSGKKLIIEGSFPRFLYGSNVICPMNVEDVVGQVVKRVLKYLGIVPTKEEQLRIDRGEIKLDRLDLVGWLKISDFSTNPGHIIAALDYGMAGTLSNRMVVAGQTLVWNSFSKYWSLMLYNKERQMQEVYPEVWKTLPPEIQAICRRYVRVELRILRKGLRELGWNEVRQLTDRCMRAELVKRYDAFLADIRTPAPPLPAYGLKVTKPLLIALLKGVGVDVTQGLTTRARRRYAKLLKHGLGVLPRHHAGLPKAYNRQMAQLKKVALRCGVPRRLRGGPFEWPTKR